MECQEREREGINENLEVGILLLQELLVLTWPSYLLDVPTLLSQAVCSNSSPSANCGLPSWTWYTLVQGYPALFPSVVSHTPHLMTACDEQAWEW